MIGNIVGESFEKYVKDQIKTRQEIYGSGFNNNRTPEQLNYLNSKLSWVKMASSVLIKDSFEYYDENTNVLKVNYHGEGTKKLTEIFDSETDVKKFFGTKLAKSAILFNGLTDLNSEEPRTGVINKSDNLNSIWNNKAYGLGGLDFGIQPMPGIISFNVKHLNRGSIKEAEINLKAFNKKQFEIIEILYLRLGYTMLIEWGNNIYIDNESKTKENIPTTLIENYWFKQNDGVEHLEMLKKIEGERRKYSGNYDAFFGRVTNFKWNFNPDGSYNITINIHSLGNVIESLTINNFTSKGKNLPEFAKDEYKNIYFFLHTLRDSLSNNTPSSESERLKNLQNSQVKTVTEKINEFKENFPKRYDNLKIKPLSYNDRIRLFQDEAVNMDLYAKSLGYDSKLSSVNNQNEIDHSCYIRFGAFLEYLRDFSFLRIKTGNSSFPILNINTDPDLNIMYAQKAQYSVDPRVCIVNNTFLSSILKNDQKEVQNFKLTPPFDLLDKWCSPENGNSLIYGKVMNIYLNFAFIIKILDEEKDNKRNINVYKFLEKICNGINQSLGGINNLEPIINEDTNSIVIMDKSIIPGKNSLLGNENEKPILNLLGYNPSNNSSNFVKNFSFQTEITPDLAIMLTIGATSNGQVLGEDTTLFSKWNTGLIDRYNPEIFLNTEEVEVNNNSLDPLEQLKTGKINLGNENTLPPTKINKEISNISLNASNKSPLQIAAEQREEAKKLFYGYLKKSFAASEYVQQIGGDRPPNNTAETGDYFQLDNDTIKQGYTLLKNYLSALAYEKKLKTNNPNPSIGFIPFNLSLELEGISGIKIYNKLVIDSKYLPSNYPENLEFLIKQVNHQVRDNVWTTNLETITVPLLSQDIDLDSPKPLEKAFELPLFAEPVIGMPIRNDEGGIGTFGASRIREGISVPGDHKGIDLATPTIGTNIFSPITGNIRITSAKFRPLQKAEIQGTGEYEGIKIELAYLLPFYLLEKNLPTKDYFKFTPINKGDYIGKSTDLTTGGYPDKVTDHVHFSVFLKRDYNNYINPDPKAGVIKYG